MNKILIILILSIIGTITATSQVVRNGNTFEVVQVQDTPTSYTYKDKNGVEYPIYITKKGACYVIKTSKKTGKQYKYYLPKDIQAQIKRELGIK